ncbi:MAG: transposase [Trueperaceae bacterium]
MTCPNGKTSSVWQPAKDAYDNEVIRVKFRHQDCIRCADRPRCMKAKQGGRATILKPREEFEALQEVRAKQQTPQWQNDYNKRAGIEGRNIFSRRSLSRA